MKNVPDGQNEYLTWMQQFARGAQTHAAELKLSPDQVQQIVDAADNLAASMAETIQLEGALRSAVMTKNERREESLRLAGELNARWRSDPDVPSAALHAVGLAPYKETPTRAKPKQVKNLVANLCNTGIVRLKFDRNGNSGRTTFVIEAAEGKLSEFRQVRVTTSSRCTLVGLDLGRMTLVRVVAVLRGEYSVPSEPAVVTLPGATFALRQAA